MATVPDTPAWALVPTQVGAEQVYTEAGRTELQQKHEPEVPESQGVWVEAPAAVITCVATPTAPLTAQGRRPDPSLKSYGHSSPGSL